MKDSFPILIIALFYFAAAVSMFTGEYAKGVFYFLSGAINLTVLFM